MPARGHHWGLPSVAIGFLAFVTDGDTIGTQFVNEELSGRKAGGDLQAFLLNRNLGTCDEVTLWHRPP